MPHDWCDKNDHKFTKIIRVGFRRWRGKSVVANRDVIIRMRAYRHESESCHHRFCLVLDAHCMTVITHNRDLETVVVARTFVARHSEFTENSSNAIHLCGFHSQRHTSQARERKSLRKVITHLRTTLKHHCTPSPLTFFPSPLAR